jgi:hypothetical protein
MLFDVRFYREEVVIDELGSSSFFVRLGIQPSTSPSRRCGTEIQQDRTILFSRCEQGVIDVLAPVNGHLPSFALANLDADRQSLGWLLYHGTHLGIKAQS